MAEVFKVSNHDRITVHRSLPPRMAASRADRSLAAIMLTSTEVVRSTDCSRMSCSTYAKSSYSCVDASDTTSECTESTSALASESASMLWGTSSAASACGGPSRPTATSYTSAAAKAARGISHASHSTTLSGQNNLHTGHRQGFVPLPEPPVRPEPDAVERPAAARSPDVKERAEVEAPRSSSEIAWATASQTSTFSYVMVPNEPVAETKRGLGSACTTCVETIWSISVTGGVTNSPACTLSTKSERPLGEVRREDLVLSV